MAHKSVLVIAAHPDDEVLGCGGTVALHAQKGDTVHVVIVCEGESLRYGENTVCLSRHTHDAAAILGIFKTWGLGYKDQKLDTIPQTELIASLENIVKEVKPQIVYCQFGEDLNRDHQLLFKVLLVATRPTESSIQGIYAFETASSTEWAYPRTFVPDMWIDISSTLEIKLQAMACYKSEVRAYPHPRSLQSLRYKAKAYGNQCCIDAAEVFMTVRRILRNGETPV